MFVPSKCAGRGQGWMVCIVGVVLLLSWDLGFADAQTCMGQVGEANPFNETDSAGLVLLNISTSAGESWSFKILSPSSQLQSYFKFETNGNTVNLVLNRTLDLEEARNLTVINGELVNTIRFSFICSDGTNEVRYERFATVVSVNEFPPVFVSLPANGFNVSEATLVNKTVLMLSDHVEDKDVSPNHLGYDFALLPYSDPSMDGREKFEIQGSLEGKLAIGAALDYDSMDPSKNYFILNVSVGDRGGMTSSGTIRINVMDADDQAPEFWYEGCTTSCSSTYSAAVEPDFQGPITWLHPAPIAARDQDTMQSPVLYYLKRGNPDDFAQYLTIDEQGGEVTVVKPVADSDAPSFFVIVEAVEDTELRHSQQATLYIQVIGRNTTSPTRPPDEKEPQTSAYDPYKIPAIVLGVLLGLALIILIVFVACRTKDKLAVSKTARKLSLEKRRGQAAAGSESSLKSGPGRERESVRSIAMRKTSGDSGIDFLRALSNPAPSDLGVRPLSSSSGTERDPDLQQLPGTTEISLSRNGPERRSGVSAISGSGLVPYEDRAELVGSAENINVSVSSAGSGEERLGVSNPVYEAEGDTDVDVSVVPLEQAHIVI